MADKRKNYGAPAPMETTDRGMFDFMKKNKNGEDHKPSEADAVASGIEKVHVSETAECKQEDKKHVGLLEQFHRSDNSSSSNEEGHDEEKKKIKKEKKEKKAGLMEKIQQKLGGHKDEHDTNVQENVYSEPSYTAPAAPVHHDYFHQEEERNGGVLDKIKEKLPGQHEDKTAYSQHDYHHHQEEEKKGGVLEKIKEKLPGQHDADNATYTQQLYPAHDHNLIRIVLPFSIKLSCQIYIYKAA